MLERARAEGRTVGAWVTQALRAALAADGLAEQVSKVQARVEALEHRLSDMERG